MFKRTILVAAIATTALAPSASAGTFSPASGSFTTPPIDVVGDATVRLGPAGTTRVSGVRQLRVRVDWTNATGIVRPTFGRRCAVDLGARVSANRRTSLRVTLTYLRESTFLRRNDRHRISRQFDAGEISAGPWDFGVCTG